MIHKEKRVDTNRPFSHWIRLYFEAAHVYQFRCISIAFTIILDLQIALIVNQVC